MAKMQLCYPLQYHKGRLYVKYFVLENKIVTCFAAGEKYELIFDLRVLICSAITSYFLWQNPRGR